MDFGCGKNGDRAKRKAILEFIKRTVARAGSRKKVARILRSPGCVDIYMDIRSDQEVVGAFDARYIAFLETIAQLRPRLHRYCPRMTGSVLDGEDVVQDALFEAYRKLDTYDDARPLTPDDASRQRD
jgi:hypothetical protein